MSDEIQIETVHDIEQMQLYLGGVVQGLDQQIATARQMLEQMNGSDPDEIRRLVRVISNVESYKNELQASAEGAVIIIATFQNALQNMQANLQQVTEERDELEGENDQLRRENAHLEDVAEAEMSLLSDGWYSPDDIDEVVEAANEDLREVAIDTAGRLRDLGFAGDADELENIANVSIENMQQVRSLIESAQSLIMQIARGEIALLDVVSDDEDDEPL